MNVLEIKNVEKSFNNIKVIDNVSLNVKEGETVVIIGASGSGKSTLLRCINNLEKIDSGFINVNGLGLIKENKNGKAIYSDKKVQSEINLSLGMVFQDFNLFPHLSVLENITKGLEVVFNKTEQESKEIAINLLKKMDLENKKDEYPCNLSGGQKQRVSIARCLAINPKLICMDEPTSALDPELVGEVLNTIKELAKEKKTMVIVTHEIKFAEEVADRIVFMDGGKIIEEGTPDEIMKNPKKERTKEFLKRYIDVEGDNVEYIDDKYLEENEFPAKEVIKFFKEISDIPRESGNEEKICEYLVDFAEKRKLEYVYEKEVRNVIIRKKVNDEEFIAFQAHTDMICEKEELSTHDFSKDPIKLIKDGDFIKADKTTLGADNGIGVAFMLAILDSKDLNRNVECIFTSEEETTMLGAINLDENDVLSKRIISLDNGKDYKMTISSANCMEWFGKIKAQKEDIDVENLVKYDLEYSSFLGGHSGGNIGDVKRGNPLKLAAAIIKPLENYYIESLSGGSRVNVIPRDFKISFYAKEDDYKLIKDEMNKQIRFYGEDGKITLEKGKEVRSNVYSQDLSKDIIGFIDSYQNGAIEYDENNNVILSANFAAIKEENDGIRFEYSLRSNDLKLRDEYIERLNKNKDIYKVVAVWEQELKGYEPNNSSYLVKTISENYKELFNEEIEKCIVQGVIEGGFFKSKIEDLDYVCIGANTFDVHSPKERLSIKSVQKVWKLLWQILKTN